MSMFDDDDDFNITITSSSEEEDEAEEAPAPAPAAVAEAVPSDDGSPCSVSQCGSIAELTAAIVQAQLAGVDAAKLKLEAFDESFEEWVAPDGMDDLEDDMLVRLQLLEGTHTHLPLPLLCAKLQRKASRSSG